METVVVELPRQLWTELRKRAGIESSDNSEFLELILLLKRAPAVGIKFDREEAHRY